ncbi:MerR family DNA-binding protein [Cupriavidus necator]|uniref:MerR family DNA-binding protein n=1 Tax=Cupriavidus necator TaxID=106590 RepID=UPI001D003266|nr:MerR family DNA-binding protein [Cupriavidus necator]
MWPGAAGRRNRRKRQSPLQRPRKLRRGSSRYPPQSLQRLHFIRRAQALGCTVDEVRTLAEHKLRVVEERLRDLRILRTGLRKLTSQCRANRDEASCPLVEALCDAN